MVMRPSYQTFNLLRRKTAICDRVQYSNSEIEQEEANPDYRDSSWEEPKSKDEGKNQEYQNERRVSLNHLVLTPNRH